MAILKIISDLRKALNSQKKQADSPIIVEEISNGPGSIIMKLSLNPDAHDKMIDHPPRELAPKIQNKIILHMKSRTQKDVCYDVMFNNRNGIIDIKCDCQAGELTKLCWHKLALIRGDSSMLADFCKMEDFQLVKEWIRNSTFKNLIIEYDKAEKAVSEAQKALKIQKINIEAAMRKGA